MVCIVLFQARSAHTTLPKQDLTFQHHLHSMTIIGTNKAINYDTILVLISGTYFTTGWMGGPYLPMPKVGLELTTLKPPVSALPNELSERQV